MTISVSNLAFQGLAAGELAKLPPELGVEIFCETGSDYYWEHLLPLLLEGRGVALSVHAPFQRLDLSDCGADFAPMRGAYEWAFRLCKKYRARDCVCHPYGGHRPADDTPEKLQRARECSLARVLELNRLAESYGVMLLVENMPETDGMLDERSFIELFAPHSELSFLIDTGHANLQRWDMDYAFEKLGSRIKGYHINDNKGDYDAHLKAGEGCFDWDSFFRGYKKYTPDASLVCEYNHGPLDEVIRSTEWIKQHLSANTLI